MMHSKYNARRVTVGDETFDSQAEYRRCTELNLMQRAGEISDLTYHPVFCVMPSFVYKGKRVRGIFYEADFSYIDLATGKKVCEDVKGMETPVFKLKQKMFWQQYPDIELRIVK